MNTLLRTLLVPSLLLLAAGGVALIAIQREAAQVRAASVADRPLAGYQDELLDLAFRAASALPANPHAKNRARLQQDVAEACFGLDAPHRALACAGKIEGWRRGAVYAEFACYAASHGATEEVQHHLELAQQIAGQGEPVITQDWQKDRILVGIAKAQVWLGHASEAAALESGLERSEAGKVDAVRVQHAAPGAFEEQSRALERLIATGDFDLVRNALEACTQLFDRYYADPDRRGWAEERIRASSAKLPPTIRIDLLLELGGFATGHADPRKALELADEARTILDGEHWLPENFVPLAARIAALRFGAGAHEEGRREADEALALFEKQRASIVDIYRAGALRPLSEAYAAMGDAAQALVLYKRAVEEGVANPNSRPRAEDLCATCCSMAVHGVEPDAELWARLRKVCAGLGQPW